MIKNWIGGIPHLISKQPQLTQTAHICLPATMAIRYRWNGCVTVKMTAPTPQMRLLVISETRETVWVSLCMCYRLLWVGLLSFPRKAFSLISVSRWRGAGWPFMFQRRVSRTKFSADWFRKNKEIAPNKKGKARYPQDCTWQNFLEYSCCLCSIGLPICFSLFFKKCGECLPSAWLTFAY